MLDMEDYEDEIEIQDVNEIGIVTGTEMEPCGRFIDVGFRKCFGFEFVFSCIWFEEFGKSFKENVLVWG